MLDTVETPLSAPVHDTLDRLIANHRVATLEGYLTRVSYSTSWCSGARSAPRV